MLGQLPYALTASAQLGAEYQRLLQRVPKDVNLQLRLNKVVAECWTALHEHGLSLASEDLNRGFDVLLRIFESQVNQIEPEVLSGN